MDRYELYYNYAHSQIREQNERIKAIQARVMNLMALNVALLGVFGLILPNITFGLSFPQILSLSSAMVIVVASVVSIFYSLKTLYLSRWHISPSLDDLQRNIQNMEHTTEQLVEWTVEGMAEAYRLNAEILDEEGRYLTKAMTGFWFTVAFLMILMVNVNLWDALTR